MNNTNVTAPNVQLYLLWVCVICFYSRTVCSIPTGFYEGWNFNSGNYLFTTDTK